MLSFAELFVILCGIAMGTLARCITLRVDTRQNPSFPNGLFINIVMGFIAATLGAVAIPAMLAKDYAAVTFLVLGITQFRDVRTLERESLAELEKTEYAKRGSAYIDGIAKTYESRNYISLLTALITVLFVKLFHSGNMLFDAAIALISGLLSLFLLQLFTRGKRIGDICELTEGRMTIDQSDLYVDGIFVTNALGTERSRDLFLNEGVAIVVHPKSQKFRLTLENLGQRQAMMFEATRSFGVKRYQFMRRSFKEGKVVIAFVPIIRDVDAIIKVMKNTPVLENSRKIHSIMNSVDIRSENDGK